MTPTEQIREALNAARMHVDCPKDRYELCTKALALLETHVLVPKEPTEEMLKRGRARYEFVLKEQCCANTYKAMIGVSE